MTQKRKKGKKDNSIEEGPASGEDKAARAARAALHPVIQASISLREYTSNLFEDTELPSLISALKEQINASEDGDLKRGESMLAAQAYTLDAIFHKLARLAIHVDMLNQLDTLLKLALRAQTQCRATWQAVAEIRHPPVAGYVGQANIAHGLQQVNNAASGGSDTPRARENPTLQNELLEEKHGERLDTGATCTPGRADPAMATLGEIDRSKDRSR